MDASRSAPRIGRTIKRARERMRMSQAEAAGALGVSRSALNAWENDRAYPRSSVGALEDLYGITIDSEPEPDEEEDLKAEAVLSLREHMREVLGEGSAAEAALDAMLAGEPSLSRRPSGGGASGRSAGRRRGRAS